MRDLRGRTALVTGATGGIGRAVAVRLAAEGVRLVLSGRRADALTEVASLTGGRAVVADLSEPGAADDLAAAAGEVDLLVANAALPASGPLDSYDGPGADRAIDVNLRSPIRLARALAPAMVGRGCGHLLFVSSLQGLSATPGAPLYVATKFGLRGFALALRQDLADSGVGVSVVLPGFVRDAGMFADSGARLPAGVGTRSPEQVAAACVRAVRRNRAEITVAPAALTAGAYIGGSLAGLSARVQRAMGAARVAERVAAGQRYKR
jgi:short-subunit dehydrogenase